MMTDLKISDQGQFYLLEFNKNEFRNSFSVDEAEIIYHHIKNAQVKPIVFISKLERVFCSGGNLKQYAKMKRTKTIVTNRKIRKALNALSNYPDLTIAYVNGDCLGGGLEVLSAFDFVISSPNSLFALWQRRIALSFGWGGGKRLVKRLGLQTLKLLSVTTKTIGAHYAKEIGLVDEIIMPKNSLHYIESIIKNHQNLPFESLDSLKNYSQKKETKVFEKYWLNNEHKEILKKYR